MPATMVCVRNGFGNHFDADGTIRKPGVPFEDPTEKLSTLFPDKFEVIKGAANLKEARQMAHPCGEDVSDKFEAACDALAEVSQRRVQVYLKGRRYRILMDDDIQDTEPANIVNAKMLSKAFKNLMESIKAIETEVPEEETEED